MNTTLKQLIYEETKQRFEQLHGPDLAVQGACLYWARCGLMTLIEHGLTPCLQAGSLMTRAIPPEQDDGIRDLYFGFKWDPDSAPSRIQRLKGLLPEIHIWLGLVREQQLIDFSVGRLADHARAHGHEWLMPDPPLFIWCSPKEIPDGFHYESNRDATLLAMEFLLKANRLEEATQLIDV